MNEDDQNQARRVVITGGLGGLGTAVAEFFRAVGWQVEAPGRGALDVTDFASVTSYFGTQELELLVCAAGISTPGLIARTSADDWWKVVRVNLHGARACALAAIPAMRRAGRGHIVLIGSHSAAGRAGDSAYAAAKAGLIGLAQDLALGHGDFGIRVNVILPGLVDTKMLQNLGQQQISALESEMSLRVRNSPADIARFIHFLHTAMPATSGQCLVLDSRKF